MDVRCPHCTKKVPVEARVQIVSRSLVQFTYTCPECQEMMLIILPEGNYKFFLQAVAIDKNVLRVDGLFDQLRHLYQATCSTFFEGGIPPNDFQKLEAFMEMLEDMIDNSEENRITTEEVRSFLTLIFLFGVPVQHPSPG